MPYLIAQHKDGTITLEFEKSKPIYRSGKGKSEILFPLDYVVLDLETTGFSAQYDEIIEVSCLRVRNSIVVDKYSSFVKPESAIDEYITELTGITNEAVSDAPSISSVLPSVVDFIDSDIIVGQNVSFDINFLYDVCSSLLGITFSNDYVDTMRMSRKLYPELNHHRLIDIVQHLNIEHSDFHRSLNDCNMAQKCFEAMRCEAHLKYPNIEDFITAFSRKSHNKLDANSLSTSVTEFDTLHPLFGKLCVFTGVLEKMDRKDAMQIVLDFGGQCGNAVTKKTNYLILGNNDYCSTIKDGKSGKQKKAEEYKLCGCDIEIIPENVFYDMIEQ